MNITKTKSQLLKKSMAYLLITAMVLSSIVTSPMPTYAAEAAWNPVTEQPVLVVTGDKLITDGAITTADLGAEIANEKSYTLDELKGLSTESHLYSAINTSLTSSIFKGEGIGLKTLLGASNLTTERIETNQISVKAQDGYAVLMNPSFIGDSTTKGSLKTPGLGTERYYFPNFAAATPSSDGAVNTPTILAWARGTAAAIQEPTTVSPLSEKEKPLLLMVGQQNISEQNNPLFNRTVKKVVVGEELPAILKIGTKNYTRAELLLMERVSETYSYSDPIKTDTVRGIPLAKLLADYQDTDVVDFISADGYTNKSVTVSDIKSSAKKYVLAYEVAGKGIYDSAESTAPIPSAKGYLSVYNTSDNGGKPIKMVSEISVTVKSGIDFVNSPFKHITNGGDPNGTVKYNIDAITGATLTVEGPGVTKSIPMAVRELENQNGGAARGEYTDLQGGISKKQTYEGIRLSYILNNMKSGDSGIVLTSNASLVQIKNRSRQTIAEFTLAQIIEAEAKGKPILVSYGTSNSTETRPFVYDGNPNMKEELGNGDGCIKLVYDKTAITGDTNNTYTKFGNMAYIYVAEASAPGYKHDKAPYNTPENAQFVFSISGDKIGRELNFTAAELEAMTDISHKDEYSLANTTYWYVQEYEGLKIWDLLLKAKLPADTATDTAIGFTTSDNYAIEKFTVNQLKNPNLFGFYEKNPADINDGKYVPVETDLKESGYPVLLAYGVNGYPYVAKTGAQGYMSGLGNDGGPLRVIFGKKDYNHANGSAQAKFANGIVVGNAVNYATHKYNPNTTYQAIANDKVRVTVKGIDGNNLSDKEYSIGELEDLIYGGSVSNTEKSKARIKDFYGVTKGSNTFSDLYEGLNFDYFLTEKVGLPGNKGTITFKGNVGSETLEVSIEDALAKGQNTTTKKTNLSPILAFAKNGAPMVSSKTSQGYEAEFVLADGITKRTIKNDGGPLSVILPQGADGKGKSLGGINSIEINLAPDKYAHTLAPYNTLANNTIAISGEGTRLTGEKTFTVAELEGKQKLAITGDYNIKESAASEKQIRYRGIDLYAFLNSVDVGLKSNADKVKITCFDNSTYEYTLADLIKKDYVNGKNSSVNNLRMMLAYGSAPISNVNVEEGKPLVKTTNTADGYDAAYDNNGGPIQIVVGQTDANDINSNKISKNVVKIEVSASSLTSWKHNVSAIYNQYSNTKFTLKVVNGATTLFEKEYTLAQLEGMNGIIDRDNYTWIGNTENEGINIWKFIKQEASTVAGIENPTSVKAFSGTFSRDLLNIFGKDALENGIKDGSARKSIILSYAMDGYPLVPSTNSDGYAGAALNGDGPLRVITHLKQDACVKATDKIVVELSGSIPTTPAIVSPLTVTGVPCGTKELDIKTIKGMTGGKSTGVYRWYNKDISGISADSVTGISLADLIKGMGIKGENYKVTLKTTDNYDGKGTYVNIPFSEIKNQNYFVAYDANQGKIEDLGKDGKTAYIRVYRNRENPATSWINRCTGINGIEITPITTFTTFPATDNVGELPAAGVRAISFDQNAGMWIGTYGGGAAYKAKDLNTFVRYFKGSSPSLKSNYAVAIEEDATGGVWIAQSGSYLGDANNPSAGVVYLKNGVVTYYDTDTPNTIPHNYVQEIKIDQDGTVWFGSFGGLTKYIPSSNTWKTWTVADGLPGTSVDNITLDGKGGVWLGCYPESETKDGVTTFKGGYAHLSANGTMTSYASGTGETINDQLLADYWVRDIALDGRGGTWIVRAGSYPNMANVGGRVDYISSNGIVTHYTGKQLLPNELTAKAELNSEIRTVKIDANGGLWFGTTADGLFYCTSVGTISGHYDSSTLSWANTAGLNNIYALAIDKNGKLVAGSAAGVLEKTFDNIKQSSDLSVLKINNGKITPSFDKNVTSYAAIVEGDVTKMNISALAVSAFNQVKINGLDAGVDGNEINLTDKETVIKVSTVAQGVTQKEYTIKVIKKAAPITVVPAHPIDGSNTGAAIAIDLTVGDVKVQASTSAAIGSGQTKIEANLPMINASLRASNGDEIATIQIPDKAKVTTTNTSWDGTIQLPTVKQNNGVTIKNGTPNIVIEIGSNLAQLNLDKPARLVLSGMAGKNFAFKSPGETSVTAITYEMSSDDGNTLGVNEVGYLIQGSDAVLWTKHFTQFIAYTDNNTSGEGGSGTAPVVPTIYDFVVDGDDISEEKGFTLQEIKNMSGKVTLAYDSLNNFGTRQTFSFTGIPVETVLKNVGLKSSAKSIKIVASDGYYRQFNLDSDDLGVYSKDKDGNSMILAWKEGSKDLSALKLVVGQPNVNSINKELWVDNIKNIRVGNKTVKSGSGSSGAGAITPKEEVDAVKTNDKTAAIIVDVLNKKDVTEKEIAEATKKSASELKDAMKAAKTEKEVMSAANSAFAVAGALNQAAKRVLGAAESKEVADSANSVAGAAAEAVTKANTKEVKAAAAAATVNAAQAIGKVIGKMGSIQEMQGAVTDLAKSASTTASKAEASDASKIKTVVKEVAQNALQTIGQQSVASGSMTTEKGKDTITITEKEIKKTIEDVSKASSEMQKTLQGSGMLEKDQILKTKVTLNAPKTASGNAEFVLKGESVAALKRSSVDQIKLNTGIAGFELSPNTFGDVGTGSDIQLTAAKVDAKNSNGGAILPLGSVVVDVKAFVGGTQKTNFGKESIVVSIPYSLAKDQIESNMVAYYINEAGQKIKMIGAKYNAETGCVDLPTTHFSQFAAAYEPIAFTDVTKGDWYYDAVYTLANKGIINGKKEGIFAPKDTITRAEFVQLLYNKVGAPSGAQPSNFKDVVTTAWYARAVDWAVSNQVVTGSGSNFMPNQKISRQDMAVILDRFEKNVEKVTLVDKNKEITFSDQATIGDYAKASVTTMQKAGVINGKGNNLFVPKDNATRAEAAKMMQGIL